MRNVIKKAGTACLAFLCVVSMLIVNPNIAKALTTQCDTYEGTNVEMQNYRVLERWSEVIGSYLIKTSDNELMRVQANALDTGILVEYYDTAYNILRTVKVTEGILPLFGAFYSDGLSYYVLSGQENKTENDDTEVFRVSKYDLNWQLLGSDGLFGVNTTIPFDAGCARMYKSGKHLLIRTAHEMYDTDNDGINHQSNVTIQFDTDSMKITDYYTDVMNKSYGYISHSFNQFILADGNNIVAVDHGDAGQTRSIVLTKYVTDFTTGKFVPDYYTKCTNIDLLKFPEANNYHYNDTGAAIGGFEMSTNNYIVAGHAINENIKGSSQISDIYNTRNIFVAILKRDLTGEPVVKQITDYEDGTASASNPHLVKIGTDRYMLMWSRYNNVYWVEIDENGTTSVLNQMEGNLSDCVPIVTDGKIIWYTWENEQVNFYEISTVDYSQSNRIEIVNGHNIEILKEATAGDNTVEIRCKRCSYTDTMTVPSQVIVYGKESYTEGNTYTTGYSSEYYEGDYVDFIINVHPEEIDNSEYIVNISDPECASYDKRLNRLTMLKKGTFTFTVQAKYNSLVKHTKEITVKSKCTQHSYSSEWESDAINHWQKCVNCNAPTEITAHSGGTATCTSKAECSVCGTEYGDYAAHSYSSEWKSDATNHWKKCVNCNATTTEGHKVSISYNKATMSGDGKITTACSVCKKILSTTVIPKASAIKLSATAYTYDGKAKTPSVTVKDSKGKTLGKGTDYDVVYASGRINVGKYKVTIKFKGKYSGTKDLYFNINPKGTTISKILPMQSSFRAYWNKMATQTTGYQLQYSTSSAFTNPVTVGIAKNTTLAYTRTSLAKDKTYYVRVRTYKTVGTTKFYSAWSPAKAVTTTSIKNVSSYKLSASGYLYDGKVKTPSVVVKNYSGKTLVKGTDYTLTYSSGRKYVGKYAVKITFRGKYSGSKVLYFTIKPKPNYISKLTALTGGFKAYWSSLTSQTTGYQIIYSTSSTFSSYKTKLIPSNKTLSTSITGLARGKRYYVKVRTYKTVNKVNYYSSWSPVKYVTTK